MLINTTYSHIFWLWLFCISMKIDSSPYFFIILKETQTFKAYQTNPTNIALLLQEATQTYWTHRLLNKSYFLFAFSLFIATCASCCLPKWQSFFISWTQYSTNFKCYKWSFVPYIVSFSGLKMVFSKLSQLDITACIKSCVFNNFNLRYFMSSIIEHLCKSFSFINSSVQSSLN